MNNQVHFKNMYISEKMWADTMDKVGSEDLFEIQSDWHLRSQQCQDVYFTNTLVNFAY